MPCTDCQSNVSTNQSDELQSFINKATCCIGMLGYESVMAELSGNLSLSKKLLLDSKLVNMAVRGLQCYETSYISLGDEELTNGSFDGNADNWLTNGGSAMPSNNWAYSADYGVGMVLHTIGDTTPIYQEGTLTEGGTYQVALFVGGTAGSVQLLLDGGDDTNIDAGSRYITWIGIWNDATGTILNIIPSNDFDGIIGQISVKSYEVVDSANPNNCLTAEQFTKLKELVQSRCGCCCEDYTDINTPAGSGSIPVPNPLVYKFFEEEFTNLSSGNTVTATHTPVLTVVHVTTLNGDELVLGVDYTVAGNVYTFNFTFGPSQGGTNQDSVYLSYYFY